MRIFVSETFFLRFFFCFVFVFTKYVHVTRSSIKSSQSVSLPRPSCVISAFLFDHGNFIGMVTVPTLRSINLFEISFFSLSFFNFFEYFLDIFSQKNLYL